MPKEDEMPDSYARKFHEDRRQHGEVAAVTIVNSDAFKDGWDRVFGGGFKILCTCGITFTISKAESYLPLGKWLVGKHADCKVPADLPKQMMDQGA
jgi:hypothetical protein